MHVEDFTKGECIVLYFVRHGQYDGQWLDEGAAADPPLTELGIKQAERVAKRIIGMKFAHIYSSTSRRAKETAKPLRKFNIDTPYTETPELLEVKKEHFLSSPEAMGEEWSALEEECDMMMRFINRLRHNHSGNDKVMIVAHGNIISSLISLIGGKKTYESPLLAIDNASISVVYFWPSSGMAVLRRTNDTSHIPADEITA